MLDIENRFGSPAIHSRSQDRAAELPSTLSDILIAQSIVGS
jgi:hypothetical protein